MENKEKFEIAKKYFKEDIKRFVSLFHYWNRYSYLIFRAQNVKDAIGDESLTMKNIPGTLRNNALIDYPFDRRICFGRFTEVLLSRSYWGPSFRSRFVWTPYTKPHTPECANFTWMTKELLEEHVNYPKNELGLDYDVVVYDAHKDSEAKGEHWDIIFDFKQLNRNQIKFILFWSRYATEFPSCLALLDALLLKERYPEEELFNFIVMASFFQHFHFNDIGNISEGQCISIYGKFITKERLIKGLENTSDDAQILEIFGRDGRSLTSLSPRYDKIYTSYVNKLGSEIPVLNFGTGESYNLDLTRFFEEKEIETRMNWYDVLYQKYNEERIN